MIENSFKFFNSASVLSEKVRRLSVHMYVGPLCQRGEWTCIGWSIPLQKMAARHSSHKGTRSCWVISHSTSEMDNDYLIKRGVSKISANTVAGQLDIQEIKEYQQYIIEAWKSDIEEGETDGIDELHRHMFFGWLKNKEGIGMIGETARS
jgi:hypothetical protein